MKLRIVYTPNFIREYKNLPLALQEEVKEKIALFAKDPRQPSLKTHKLKGRLQGSFSFSVNYRYRIIFEYDSGSTVALLGVGDHSIYG